MSSKISSHGLGAIATLTAVLADSPARSRASRMDGRKFDRIGNIFIDGHLQQLTCHPVGGVFDALAGFGFDRWGAAPPWRVHTRPPAIAARLHLSPFLRCAVQRCASTSGLAWAHHCSLHLTTGFGAERSFMPLSSHRSIR